MCLWHIKLIHLLPRQQLLGQHRECCALRGLGWGKKPSVVDYVFKYPYVKLYKYHEVVMDGMAIRGYRVNPIWHDPRWRGNKVGFADATEHISISPIYPEHDDSYLNECLSNLKRKCVEISYN